MRSRNFVLWGRMWGKYHHHYIAYSNYKQSYKEIRAVWCYKNLDLASTESLIMRLFTFLQALKEHVSRFQLSLLFLVLFQRCHITKVPFTSNILCFGLRVVEASLNGVRCLIHYWFRMHALSPSFFLHSNTPVSIAPLDLWFFINHPSPQFKCCMNRSLKMP